MDKKLVRDVVLRALGVERSYKPKALVAHPEWQMQDVLKFVVGNQLLQTEDFRFVQIGAFDGVANDAMYEIARRHNLPGILVEPQPGAFEQLQRNYRGCPNIILVNGAVAASDGTRDFYTTGDLGLQQASFDRTHLLRHKIPEGEIVTRQVTCYRLESLLEKHGFDHIDLLQIDAEGYDCEIIKTIDFRHIKPAIIRFEHAHLSERDAGECLELLASHGYRFWSERRDTLAYCGRSGI